MRFRRGGAFLALCLAFGLGGSSVASAQDFDPRGRRRPPKPPTAQPRDSGGPGPRRPPPKAGSDGASAAPGRPGPGDEPSGRGALIDRYTRIVLQQPGSPFPLQRLAQLYRERDGGIEALVRDFEARAAQSGTEQWAATVALAGIYKIDGRGDDAVKAYERALTERPDDPAALLALARVHQERGATDAARARYEQALAKQTNAAEREQTLRTLMALSLDAKDWDGAKRAHAQLVRAQPTSLFLKGELGRELFARGEYERAEAEFKELVAASTGDNRTLAPALKELGRAQAKADKADEALATLRRALSAAGAEAGVRAEIYEIITEIHRARQNLPVLVKQLEAERPNDFARLALLGSLYEETGDAANALATYRRALAINPRHIDLRLKLVRLLQSQGELDKAIAEYEGLIRAAPNNPQFVFEQCDALLQRGDRARALKLLGELEARASTDEEVLGRLAEFYGRIGESEKSLRVLTRLTQVASSDPSHLVDLGERYFQDGNVPLAVQTWKRMLTTVTPRARALAALGDVYLEHDMLPDALAALKEATQLDPGNLGYKKQLATVYERARNFREARSLWVELSERAKQGNDKLLAREARSRLVTIWALERVLEQQVIPLQTRLSASPPDVEAGRMLAEVQIHLRRLPDAEATLNRVLELAPGDVDGYLTLERVLVQQNKLPAAIAVLEKLVQVEPKRARELYQRMAQYALQTYKDEDAIRYAARAVELNPEDAEGHRRLAEMYRSRQDVERAIFEYRQAIARNERLYVVYFELADLLLSRGETDEADRLFRRVVRSAPDEELVARAARLSMQINLGRGTLESLEQDLLPLAIGNPQRPVYRRLLVEIYGNLTFGLVQRVRHGSGREAEEARAQLAKIGSRAVKPLLDALAEGDGSQQRIAIDVLGYVQNKNAGLPLFAFAVGPSDTQLRTRAMIAAGALRDPALLPRFEGFLSAKRNGETGDGVLPTDAVAVAAVWGASHMADRRAVPLLRRITRDGTPEMRALAVLGLGLSRDKGSVAEVASVARSVDSGTVARAAAALALGELDATAEVPTLLALAQGGDALPRQMALVALARMAGGRGEPPGGKAALHAMADGLFSASDIDSPRARLAAEAVQRAAASSLVMLDPAARAEALRRTDEAWIVPEGPVDVEATLSAHVPRGFSVRDRANAFVRQEEAIKRAAAAALQTSGARARAVLDALGPEGDAFEPLLSRDEARTTPDAQARARELARALEPGIVPLARHPDPQLRTKAIVLLSRSSSDAAAQAVVQALDDPNEAVQRVALSAIGAQATASSVAAVARLLQQHDAWSVRVLAAQALGQLGEGGQRAEATRALRQAALRDGYALVREAALRALARFDAGSARAVAGEMAQKDPEPRVRESALAIARGEQ